MSLTELNNNTTFDHFPNEIRVNRTINYPNNYNMATISRTRKSPIIYGRGVDDYVTNEIKKAKYQGCFDPGSLGNKNIFIDNRNFNTEKNINIKSNLNTKNKILDNNRYSNYSSSNIHKHDEGKNLLIEKSVIQYPLKFYKSNFVLSNRNNNRRRKNNSFEYYYYSSPSSIKKNYYNNKNTKHLILNNLSFYTPIYRNRNTRKEIDRYQNKTTGINPLMNSYHQNSKILNKIRKNNFTINSNDLIKGSTILAYNRENDFSPIVFSSRNSIYDQSHSNNCKKKKQLYQISRLKNDDKNLNYSYFAKKISNDIITKKNNEFLNEDYNNDYSGNNNHLNNIENSLDKNNDKDNENNNTNNIKLIYKYRKKILSLFIRHLNKFYVLHFFNNFISQLKNIKNEQLNFDNKSIENGQYKFENKSISHLSEIKKNLMNNTNHYGYDKQYNNLIKDIKNKHNKQSTKLNNSNNDKQFSNNNNKKYIETNFKKLYIKENNNNNNSKKKKYIYNNKKIKKDRNINIKEYNENRTIETERYIISNKQYIKKKLTQNIYCKPKNEKKRTVKEVLTQNINLKTNILNDEIDDIKEKIKKSIDRAYLSNNIKNDNSNNEINKLKNKPTLIKNKNVVKTTFFKKTIPNSFIKIKNKIYKIKENSPKELNNNKNIKDNLLQLENRNKNIFSKKLSRTNINEYDSLEGIKSDANNLNMSTKYLEMNNNNICVENKKDKKIEFIIENNIEYTFRGKNNKDKKKDMQTFSDKKLESSISIITKIMENKKKDEKKNKIKSLLLKIIHNKIQKDENQKLELIKKCFNLLKNEKNYGVRAEKKFKKKLKLDLLDSNTLNMTNEELLSKKLLNKKDNKNLPKTDRGEKRIIFNENNEGEEILNKSKGKFRVVIKKIKIHKTVKKNILDSKIRKIKPIKSPKNCFSFITDINEIPAKNISKKTISLTLSEDYKSMKDKNINISTNKSDIDNKEDINKIQNDKQKENINKGKIDENKEQIKKEQNDEEKEDNKENIKEDIMEDVKKDKKDNIKNNKIKKQIKFIEKEESIDNYQNYSSNFENIKKNNTFFGRNSKKKFNNNFKIIKKNTLTKNTRKSYINSPRIRTSIEIFNKNRKYKSKLSKNSESGNGPDITLNEKYQDYENLIYYLRVQLIYCFFQNTKKNESYND